MDIFALVGYLAFIVLLCVGGWKMGYLDDWRDFIFPPLMAVAIFIIGIIGAAIAHDLKLTDGTVMWNSVVIGGWLCWFLLVVDWVTTITEQIQHHRQQKQENKKEVEDEEN